jgi:hypothetical protein
VIYLLPLVLLVVATGFGLYARFGGTTDHGGTADHGGQGQSADRPLALPPVDAPDADSPACARLLAALPAELTASPRPLPRLALRSPAPVGAAAWAGRDVADPVVLRCGLPRPAELTATSPLIVINGVSWLELSQPDRETFIAVDRPVYVALTVPAGLGSGPVQTVSDTVRAALAPK